MRNYNWLSENSSLWTEDKYMKFYLRLDNEPLRHLFNDDLHDPDTFFSSDLEPQERLIFVLPFGSNLSRAFNLHHFGSNFHADFKGLSQLSLSSLLALS